MGSNLQRESPMNRNCSGVLENRSISDVVMSLRVSFLDSDYNAAVRELMKREEGLLKKKEEIVDSLREKNDSLESELGDWKIKYCKMEEEFCRWKRDFYENDKLLKELRKQASLKLEKEERGLRSYERLLEEIRGLEDEKGGYNRKVLELSSMVDELKTKLKNKEAEMDEIVGKKNAELKARLVDLEGLKENVELDACLLKLNQEKDEVGKRIDDDVKHLEVQVKPRCANEGMQQMKLYLKEQKAKYDARVEELTKSLEVKDEKMKKLLDYKDRLLSQIEGMTKANDEHIKKLKMENEGLGVKIKELEAESVQAKEKLSKLERDMFTFMCFDLDRDPKFASAPVGKVFSGIIKALDPEKSNLNCNAGVAKDGIPQEAVFVSQSDLLKRCSEPEKQSREAGEILKRRSVPINIDRGNEYGNPLRVNGVINKRQLPGSLSEQRNHVGSGNDTPNPIDNVMKRKHVLRENVQQEPSHAVLSASRSKRVSKPTLKQKLATLIQLNENYSPSGFSNGNGSKNARDEALMACILQREQFKRIENAAEMARAFEQGNEYGNPLHVNGLRNKQQWPGSLNGQRNHVSSSDDTLNPIHKMMKHRHVLCENVQQEPSHDVLSASRIGHVSNTTLKHKLATLDQSKEDYRGKDKVPSSGFSNGNGSHAQPEELTACLLQRKQFERIENAAEMARAFAQCDEYGNPLHVNGVRNKRQWPGSLNEQRNHVGSSDDTLNPIHKMMKRRHLLPDEGPSHAVLSASRFDHVSNPSLKQKVATLEESKENYRGKDTLSSSGFLNVNGSKNSYGTSNAAVLFIRSPIAEEFMAPILQRKQYFKRIENAAEMARAVDLDDELSAVTVCALHRFHMSSISGMKAFTYYRSEGLEECDIGRMSALANILTDGVPGFKPKKSLDELRQEDRVECKRLALKYSELFFILSRKIGFTATLYL